MIDLLEVWMKLELRTASIKWKSYVGFWIPR